jgi:hypothetical protein
LDGSADDGGASDASTADGNAADGSTADVNAGDGSAGDGSAPSPLLATAYTLVSDSSGTTPGAGTSITLLFEPGGKALILAANDSAMLGHHGTWAYAAGQLALAFSSSDFHPNAMFTLDLTASQVTMPFQVFSTDPGSSTWAQFFPDSHSGAYMAAFGLMADPVAPCVTQDQVVAELAEYVSGRTGVALTAGQGVTWPPGPPDFGDAGMCDASGGSVGGGAVDGGADDGGSADGGAAGKMMIVRADLGLARFAAPGFAGASGAHQAAPAAGPVRVLELPAPEPVPINITVVDTGLLITYPPDPVGGIVQVKLTPFLFFTGGGASPLAPGNLASDPRTDLVPQSPHDGTHDAVNKTAVIINPLTKQTSLSVKSATVAVVNHKLVITPQSYAGSLTGPLGPSQEGRISQNLANAGYSVLRLDDTNANILDITQTILMAKNPGVVEIFTHGSDDGAMATADMLGTTATPQAPTSIEQANAAASSLKGALVKTLGATVTDSADEAALLASIIVDGVPLWDANHKRVGAAWVLDILPAYWTWLRNHGADFSSSLVFAGACFTAKNTDLSEALQAKAYIGYNQVITADDANDVGEYLSSLMGRPTFSAEEAFYNAYRVARTRQMVFADDAVFNHVDTSDNPKAAPADDFSPYFVGYGRAAAGSAAISYYGDGWLTTSSTFNGGQVWIMTWAGRWGQNAQTGAQSLVSCYNAYWQNGNTGGLADPFCQNANGGSAPTADEVGYATYLLTGVATPGFSGTLVPRFTLNDGR